MGLFSRAVDRMVSEKVPHKRRRRMIVFVAILTLLSMVTSTVAWFSVNTFAGVDKIDVHISVAAQLRVSMEDHGSDINAYVKTITNEMVDTYLARQNTRLSEIVLDPVTTANGTAIFFMKGILRPFGFFERSERFAMSGSVTASKILPAAVIAPMMVSAPKITSPCGMNSVCPFAIDSWFGR